MVTFLVATKRLSGGVSVRRMVHNQLFFSACKERRKYILYSIYGLVFSSRARRSQTRCLPVKAREVWPMAVPLTTYLAVTPSASYLTSAEREMNSPPSWRTGCGTSEDGRSLPGQSSTVTPTEREYKSSGLGETWIFCHNLTECFHPFLFFFLEASHGKYG